MNHSTRFLMQHGLPIVFTRYGLTGVVVAKFLPGMSAVTPPLAGMAGLLLDRKGFTRVRPLKGGIDAWRKNNYPMEAWAATVTSAEADISADPQTASENPTAIPGKQN